ncbi:MAG: hypothetical protein COU69_01020 [Candidatus Pacebacteria bacterium CG10_big_fil_rev_8_21_14_0_10_56_10]|nr:MAG: hypothetical protein COU69_01020 [Candidatus Pacebacteria bacterium CG10_big_fil_rev_8_21_14_0_10_56_10]
MGALPKNKITRAERGKRRSGNSPRLRRDSNVYQVTPDKRGLVAQISTALGLQRSTDQSSTHQRPTPKPTKT